MEVVFVFYGWEYSAYGGPIELEFPLLVLQEFGGGCWEEGLESGVPEEGHGELEVSERGEDGVPWRSRGRGVEDKIRGQEAVDCGGFWEGAGYGFGDCVGGVEGGDGDG